MDPSDPTEAAAEFPRQVLSVSELTAALKEVLEGCFPKVWVSGEISNLSRPQSGHSYFTLKDDQAQIRAVLWRTAASRVKFDVQDGMQVICQGYLDLYAPRGTYQLVIEQMLPKGMGALELALRKLRERLAAEGLFDPNRKRPLPRFPRRIALVTSPTGAAVRDFLEVLRRRWRGVDVLIIPVRVQGAGAAREIAAGIELANRLRQPIDVLVVARGGGSLEDLWAFNEEPVVRAIFASRIPVISAVGPQRGGRAGCSSGRGSHGPAPAAATSPGSSPEGSRRPRPGTARHAGRQPPVPPAAGACATTGQALGRSGLPHG